MMTTGATGSLETNIVPIINTKLRVVVFDDGDQVRCVWMSPAEHTSDFATYKEPEGTWKITKERQDELEDGLWSVRGEELFDQIKRWIHCVGDLRKSKIFLDLEEEEYPAHHFGSVTLGEGSRRKAGKRLKQTCEDGTYLEYSMHYGERDKYENGRSWFRMHEIKLPLARLKRGVSNVCI